MLCVLYYIYSCIYLHCIVLFDSRHIELEAQIDTIVIAYLYIANLLKNSLASVKKVVKSEGMTRGGTTHSRERILNVQGD